MSTRRSASLDGTLLARKGDATPAIPEYPVLPGGEAPPRMAAPRLPDGVAAPPPAAASGGDAPDKARIAPMTSSRRGLAVLVSLALLALVSVAAERLVAPADRMAAAPSPDSAAPVSEAPRAEAPATETAVLGAPPDLAAMPHMPPPDAPPAVEAPRETLAEPVPESAPPPAEAVTAAVVSDTPLPPVQPAKAVSDTPLPPVPPAKKAIGRKAAALTPPPAAGPYSLQLAAFSSAASARGEAARLQERLDAVLGGRAVAVEKAGSDRRPVYRLRASGYPTLAAARAACEGIRKLKTACLVLRR